MRSNDIVRGLPYNFVQFTTLHEIMAGWLGLKLGSYTHVVNCLHYYHKDRTALEKIKSDKAIPNPDSLQFPKTASVKAFAFLNELISGAASSVAQVEKFAYQLDLGKLPESVTNIGNVILAEAARRHNNLNLASQRMSRLTNPCLRALTMSFFARFQPTG